MSPCICNARLAMFHACICAHVHMHTGMALGRRTHGLITITNRCLSNCYHHLIVRKIVESLGIGAGGGPHAACFSNVKLKHCLTDTPKDYLF